jgi:hypothetical protein
MKSFKRATEASVGIVFRTCVTAALTGILCVATAHAGPVLTFFSASTFNANTAVMDATLGITGYTIDDFETTTLLPGLTIDLTGGVPATTWTTLPGLSGSCGIAAWDGPNFTINTITNQFDNCNTPSGIAASATFNYTPGTTSFGIGLSGFQSTNPPSPDFPITNHELFVNGVDLGVLETLAGANWTPGGVLRNAYLRIDSNGASPITSVGFENLSGGDVMGFDRLAVQAPAVGAPEPGSGWLLLLGAVPVGWIRLRSRWAK